jgi:cytochrome c oxidase subunit 2
MSARERRPMLRAVLLAPLALVLTGCAQVSGLGFEEGLSSVNDISLSLWQGSWIAAGVVGVFTLILILWPAGRP